MIVAPLVEGFVPALADAISTRLTPILEGITAKLAPPLSPLAELEALACIIHESRVKNPKTLIRY